MLFWLTLAVLVGVLLLIALFGHSYDKWESFMFTLFLGGPMWGLIFGLVVPGCGAKTVYHKPQHFDGKIEVVDNPNGGEIYNFVVDGKRVALDRGGDSVHLRVNNKNTFVKVTKEKNEFLAPYDVDNSGWYILNGTPVPAK